MKVALIGGTGTFGRGLALRLSANNEVFIGSRDSIRAIERALELSRLAGKMVSGDTNAAVARQCDAAILAVPDVLDTDFLEELADPLSGKLVISPIVPMSNRQGRFIHSLARGSAAERVATILSRSAVAAAFHTLPAVTLAEHPKAINFDVLVCADSKEVFDKCALLITSIEGMRPLFAGSLSDAREVESLTPLILNVARFNGLKRLSIRFVH